MKANLIKDKFNETLKARGYLKRGNSWYMTTAECIVVLNLQRSSYGNFYYLNLAALLLKGDDLQFPKEYQCDVRMRFPITKIERYSVQQILDLDSKMDIMLRKDLLEKLSLLVISILKKLESIDGIIELYSEFPELNNMYPLSSVAYRKTINESKKVSPY